GRLESPFRATHKSARRVGLVEFETVGVLSPKAVRAAEVFVEQTYHRAERMQHQPLADQAVGIRQAIGKTRRSREQKNSRRADAIRAKNRDGGLLKMFFALAIDIHRAGDQSGGINFQPPHARASDEPHAALNVL